MKRIKIFSSYDFRAGVYHCPCCGKEIGKWEKISNGKFMSSPLGKLEEYLLTCSQCFSEIDYLMMTR